MPFWAQGNHWLESWCITRDRLRRVALQNAREDNLGLQLREWHTDTGARASSKGKICSGRDLLLFRWIPTLRFEHLRVLPDFGKAMHHPLTQDEQRTDWQLYTINFGLFGDEAHL